MNRRERIDKIRTLARRGATEGERAAARAALGRMGESPEAPRAAAEPLIGSRPGSTFTWTPPPTPPTSIFTEFLNEQAIKDMHNFITAMFDEFNTRLAAMQKAGLSTEEINRMVVNGTFRTWKEAE